MSSMALVVDRRGSRLSIGNHDVLCVHHADGECERVGLRALGEIVLIGEVAFDSSVLLALARAQVAMTSLPLRGSMAHAAVMGVPTQGARVRLRQYQAASDPVLRLAVARVVLVHKLRAMQEFAKASGDAAAVPYEQALAALPSAHTTAELMGIEGAASRQHFAYFRDRVPHGWRFAQRQRQPPPDGVNALLSLGYSLALAPAVQTAQRCGLDAQIGFLHGTQRDHPALALDLLEPARPVIDGFVLGLLREEFLSPADFTIDPALGARLAEPARKLFYPRWFAVARAAVQAVQRRLRDDLLAAMPDLPNG